MSRSAELGEQKSIAVTGGTLNYRERGSGPPILFVHGLLVNGDLWRKVVPELHSDHRCITPDLPLGSHEEPFDSAAELTPLTLARMLRELIEGLGLEDLTVVANDTGGAITQMLIAENPDLVARLVLTPCDVGKNFLPLRFRYLQWIAKVPASLGLVAQSVRIGFIRNGPIAFGPLAKHGIDDAAAASYTEPPRRNAGVRRDVAKVLNGISTRDSLAALDRLPAFRGRSLIVWSDDGRVFPRKDAEALAQKLPGARIEIIDDSYAFVPEDQPQRLAGLIREFATEAQPG